MGVIFFNKENFDESFILKDKKINSFFNKKYKFEVAFYPQKYNVIFICLKSNDKDSNLDLWKAVFFKKTKKQDITIDTENLKQGMKKETKEEIYIFKEIDGNYEEIIQISIDLIKKYKK